MADMDERIIVKMIGSMHRTAVDSEGEAKMTFALNAKELEKVAFMQVRGTKKQIQITLEVLDPADYK